VRFDVFVVVTSASWHVALCSVVDIYQCFGKLTASISKSNSSRRLLFAGSASVNCDRSLPQCWGGTIYRQPVRGLLCIDEDGSGTFLRNFGNAQPNYMVG